MSRKEIVGILGIVVSVVIAVLGYLWNVQFLQFLASILFTATVVVYFIPYKLQMESEERKNQRERNIEMRDLIYGPLFRVLSGILNTVRLTGSLDWSYSQELEDVTNHYMFFTVKQDIRDQLAELLDRVDKYQRINRATEVMLHDLIRKEVEKVFHVDIGSSENSPNISLLIGRVHVSSISLMSSLIRRIAPQDFLDRERKKWGKNCVVEVSIGGSISEDVYRFESLYQAIRQKLETDPLYQEEKDQYIRLLGELEQFLEKLEAHIKLQ